MWPDFSILCDVWTLVSQREPKQTAFKSLRLCLQTRPRLPIRQTSGMEAQHSFLLESQSEAGAKIYSVRSHLKMQRSVSGRINGLVSDTRTKQKTSGDNGWPEADTVFWRRVKRTVVYQLPLEKLWRGVILWVVCVWCVFSVCVRGCGWCVFSVWMGCVC